MMQASAPLAGSEWDLNQLFSAARRGSLRSELLGLYLQDSGADTVANNKVRNLSVPSVQLLLHTPKVGWWGRKGSACPRVSPLPLGTEGSSTHAIIASIALFSLLPISSSSPRFLPVPSPRLVHFLFQEQTTLLC